METNFGGDSSREFPIRRAAAALIALSAALGVGLYVLETDAGLAYDEAGYLTRALYHAAQVSDRGFPAVLRLPWSLMFETPKPPLFTGWLALVALLAPAATVPTVLLAGTVLPLAALTWVVGLLARTGNDTELAAPLAVVALLSSALVLEMGTRLLVETTLSVCVVATALVALDGCRRGMTRLRAAGVGGLVGLTLLGKFLAPLFVVPVGIVVALELREHRVSRISRGALSALLTSVAVVAGPWYLRNGWTAFEFALEASRHQHSLYMRPWWTRPVHLLTGALGWPMLVMVCMLVVHAIRSRADGNVGLRLLRSGAWSTALVSGLVIASRPVFDPRFWLPSVALLAAWAGAEASAWLAHARQARYRVAVAAAVFLLGSALWAQASRPRAREPWESAAIVREIANSMSADLHLCTLGANAEWNIEKLRLAVELARLRPRPVAVDLLGGGSETGVAERMASCDVVFALDPAGLDQGERSSVLNRHLARAFEELKNEFVLDSMVSRRLNSRAPIRVFRRYRQSEASDGSQRAVE